MKKIWNRPSIIAQSPMDGVTDAAFRYITDKYGKPDILFTEFVPVEAIDKGAAKVLSAFTHHKTNTPIVAQIYGTDLKAYYKAAIVACEYGFDAIDINMGCPDKTITKRGAGAGLIQKPKHAQKIVITVKKAVKDWHNGLEISKIGLHENITDHLANWKMSHNIKTDRHLLPVSVKTRIGYDKPVVKEWILYLTETQPVAISIHGRTLSQMYTGKANWNEIAKAVEVVKNTGIKILGNGDVTSLPDARNKMEQYKVDGVLIGRASFGNPWIFKGEEVDYITRLSTAIEHCERFVEMTPELYFLSLRKHLAWYCKGFDNAAEVRKQLMTVNNVEDVKKVLEPIIHSTKVLYS